MKNVPDWPAVTVIGGVTNEPGPGDVSAAVDAKENCCSAGLIGADKVG